MKPTTIVAIILGVLIIISVVQAFQLNGLKTKMEEGKLSIGSSSSKTSATSSGDSNQKTSTLPSSVKDLPQMVGGC